MNILGTSQDYQTTNCPFADHIRFVRLPSNWGMLWPSPTGPDPVAAANLAILIGRAAADGKTIMFDIANPPAWVLADPNKFIYNLQRFVTFIVTRWPQIKILGIDNEFCITNAMNPGASPAQLATFYYNFALAVFQIVPPTVELNIIKAAGFNQAWDICRALQATNIGRIAKWATIHRYSQPWNPLCDVANPKNSEVVFGVEAEMKFMRQWFPGCRVGYDELCNYDPAQTMKLAVALERAKPDMAIVPLLCVGGTAGSDSVTVDSYGVAADGSFKPHALAIAQILGGAL